MPNLLLVLVVGFLVSMVLTGRVRSWADRAGILDYPDGSRHGPRNPVPRCGGVAIYLAAMAVGSLAIVFALPQVQSAAADLGRLGYMTLGGTMILLLGLADDTRDLDAWVKLSVEAAVAAAMFWGGLRLGAIRFPGESLTTLPLWLDFAMTVVWIVGITNAFNLIDGSDGVAAGAALFALLTLGVVSIVNGNVVGALVSIILVGATLGFLVYNFPPASIYLGDSGSLFLGFALATVGILTTQRMPTAMAVSVPVVCFGLPILDTGLAIVRRFLRGQHVFRGDRGHIHHRLRDLGHSPRGVALMLYGVCAVFSIVALVLMNSSGAAVSVVLAVIGVLVIFAVQWLGFPEFRAAGAVVGRTLQTPKQQRLEVSQTLRIQEAVKAMGGAVDGDSVVNGLQYVFGASEFDRVQVWLPRGLGKVLERVHDVRTVDGLVVWTWEAEGGESDPARLWEIRLPIRGPGNSPVGRLSLWRSVDGDHVFTDLRLLAVELLPSMRSALEAMGAETPRPSRVDPVGRFGD